MKRRTGLILLSCVLAMSMLTGCGGKDAAEPKETAKATATATKTPEAALSVDPTVPQKVKVTMENGKTFVIETAPQYAPETVKNFLTLVESGFYDGLTFHRIIDGFMAQGGDPKGNGTGGSGKTIKGEFADNGFEQNTLSHTRGVVSMARSNQPDSASSQFFICYADVTYLDGQYAAFGKVIEGMETVDEFLKTPTNSSDKPTTPIVMEKVAIVK
ncbi:MAG: peptidylprolyl isomerase [Clostridia bacterium]|nr:peptidylprolyl isomerase [Clostridia bacterium]